MRTKFKVLSVEKDSHVSASGESYVFGRATDNTNFLGDPIIFTFSCPAGEASEGDIISAELRDPRQPTFLHEVFVEQRYTEPTFFVAPEAIELPEPPAPSVVEHQHDELAFTIQSGYGLSQSDVGALGKRFLQLEAQFHEHVRTCGCK